MAIINRRHFKYWLLGGYSIWLSPLTLLALVLFGIGVISFVTRLQHEHLVAREHEARCISLAEQMRMARDSLAVQKTKTLLELERCL